MLSQETAKKLSAQANKRHENIANIRKEFCHQTSHKIVANPTNKIIVLEDLNTKGMTKRPAIKQDEQGRYLKNQAKAKAGLNKSILDQGWQQLEQFLSYKTQRAGKAYFKVSAHHTSQECAACGHTHPDNRRSQAEFACVCCGHTDNADRNAAMVIKKRAITMIKHSGSELSKRGVLTLPKDKGRGAESKTVAGKLATAVGTESSKKKRKAACKAA